jgi:hypothetical protein
MGGEHKAVGADRIMKEEGFVHSSPWAQVWEESPRRGVNSENIQGKRLSAGILSLPFVQA